MEKIPYTRTLKPISDDAVQFFILDQVVKSGHWLFIQNLAAEDETNAPAQIRIGRGKDESEVHWWECEPNPAAGVLYHSEKVLLFVPEGNRVIGRFDGTVADDQLRLYVDGYLTPKVLSRQVFRHRERERERAGQKPGG